MTRTTLVLTRGPAFHPGGHHASWADVFLQAALRSFAWHTVGGLFHMFGVVAVVVGVVVLVVAWLRSRRPGRRRAGGRR